MEYYYIYMIIGVNILIIVGVGREAHINWTVVTCKMAAPVRNYLEDYWPRAGGLSTVNAIGTQLRDGPMNSGLTRWRIWRF